MSQSRTQADFGRFDDVDADVLISRGAIGSLSQADLDALLTGGIDLSVDDLIAGGACGSMDDDLLLAA